MLSSKLQNHFSYNGRLVSLLLIDQLLFDQIRTFEPYVLPLNQEFWSTRAPRLTRMYPLIRPISNLNHTQKRSQTRNSTTLWSLSNSEPLAWPANLSLLLLSKTKAPILRRAFTYEHNHMKSHAKFCSTIGPKTLLVKPKRDPKKRTVSDRINHNIGRIFTLTWSI